MSSLESVIVLTFLPWKETVWRETVWNTKRTAWQKQTPTMIPRMPGLSAKERNFPTLVLKNEKVVYFVSYVGACLTEGDKVSLPFYFCVYLFIIITDICCRVFLVFFSVVFKESCRLIRYRSSVSTWKLQILLINFDKKEADGLVWCCH